MTVRAARIAAVVGRVDLLAADQTAAREGIGLAGEMVGDCAATAVQPLARVVAADRGLQRSSSHCDSRHRCAGKAVGDDGAPSSECWAQVDWC